MAAPFTIMAFEGAIVAVVVALVALNTTNLHIAVHTMDPNHTTTTIAAASDSSICSSSFGPEINTAAAVGC